MHVIKNYNTDVRDRTVIGGVLEFEGEGSMKGFPGAENQEESTATQVSGLKNDFNALLLKLKKSGIMVPDSWNLSVLACPTLSSMPASEIAANSGHATVSVDGT